MTGIMQTKIGSGYGLATAILNEDYLEGVQADSHDIVLGHSLQLHPVELHTYLRFRSTLHGADAAGQIRLAELFELYVAFFTEMRGVTPTSLIAHSLR